MLAYNMLLGVVPVALLGLFVAGQVLSSDAISGNSGRARSASHLPGRHRAHAAETVLPRQVKDRPPAPGARAVREPLGGVVVLGALTRRSGGSTVCNVAVAGAEALRGGDGRRRAAVQVSTVAVPAVESILKAGAQALPLDLQARRRAHRRGLARCQPHAAVGVPDSHLDDAFRTCRGPLACDLSRRDRRDCRDWRRRLRLPDLPDEHLDDRAVRSTTIVFV